MPDDDGTRSTVVTLPPGRFAFRYLADNGAFLDDVDADEHEPNGYGQLHSVVVINEVPISGRVSDTDSDGAAASVDPEASDDLIRVDGIGPKIADALRAAGIASFGALAGASEFTLRSALKAAGLRSHPTLPTWAAQAEKLAGD
ncbi:MAG: helix-hairpin-helix domain-containing protein [Acidimicrobiia bacterium]